MIFNKINLPAFGVLLEARRPGIDLREVDVGILRKIIEIDRLLLLRGFRVINSSEEFGEYCSSFGIISEWPFGKVLELREQECPKDHIFDHRYVPLHWDGMYRPLVPELQIFQCVDAPSRGQGGGTIFSNTIQAIEYAPRAARTLWEKVSGSYQRKMEFYDSHTVSPVMDIHPICGLRVIRYNEPENIKISSLINPPDLRFTGLGSDDLIEFHRTLQQALYSSNNFYAHEWQTGDILIADNFALLHGREAFVTKSPRCLRRVHVLSDPPVVNDRLLRTQ